jgi:uncharacterized protein YndB with AHSA1/START domain
MTDDLNTDDLYVERDVVIDRPADEVWRLIATAAGWQEWMVDEATVDVEAGRDGSVVDGDVVRRVVVTDVDPARSVTFRWWEHDDPASASEVSIHLDDLPAGGSRVHITERVLLPSATAFASSRSVWSGRSVWEVRACLLALALHSPARV